MYCNQRWKKQSVREENPCSLQRAGKNKGLDILMIYRKIKFSSIPVEQPLEQKHAFKKIQVPRSSYQGSDVHESARKTGPLLNKATPSLICSSATDWEFSPTFFRAKEMQQVIPSSPGCPSPSSLSLGQSKRRKAFCFLLL